MKAEDFIVIKSFEAISKQPATVSGLYVRSTKIYGNTKSRVQKPVRGSNRGKVR